MEELPKMNMNGPRSPDRSLIMDELMEKGMKNKKLDREVQGWHFIVFYSFVYISFDLWKQVTTYGMKYYNKDQYPVPQTITVFLIEFIKFCFFFVVIAFRGELHKVRLSYWFAVPSLLYAFNNNIYMTALYFVTPPIWNILIQVRVINTAALYRFKFKQNITLVQWISLFVLVVSIILTNFSGGQTLSGSSRRFLIAIFLAIVGSLTSVAAAVTTEYLYKNNKRDFFHMQLQTYLFSSACSLVFVGGEILYYGPKKAFYVDPDHYNLVIFLCATSWIMSCSAGIAVALIVKKLDNIVKLYTQALSNMTTSFACWFFFPDHFHVNFLFAISLIMMILAIIFYEQKTLPSNLTALLQEHWMALLALFFLSFFIFIAYMQL